jgi:hypothetical protein
MDAELKLPHTGCKFGESLSVNAIKEEGNNSNIGNMPERKEHNT